MSSQYCVAQYAKFLMFLEKSTDAAMLLEMRAHLDELEETTVDSISIPLINGLKRSIFQQQLDNSNCVTDTSRNFTGKRFTGGHKKPSSTKRC